MASLNLKHIYKVYQNNVKAVNDVNLDINDKEFVVFVGPSGCGKSTTLRMIAGLEEISSGELRIDDKIVNNIEPKDRDIAMVFQNYALYPHMSVYENMAFGLRIKKIPNDEIHNRIIETSKILGITEYLERKPKAMSGGQRQRVALGRAIVRNPKVFLLDEPLSNLDAKLRTQMRSEILKLHKKLNTTFIYVTHDQVEAMTMGTRIVVMKDGYLQQIDTPKNLYKYPINKFVASFIGTPQMNFLNAILSYNNNNIIIKFVDYDNEIIMPYNKFIKLDKKYLDGLTKVIIGIRSENITISKVPSKNNLKVKISHIEDLGDEMLVYTFVENNESNSYIVIKHYNDIEINIDDNIYLEFDFEHIHLFDYQTEESINNVIPNNNIVEVVVDKNVINIFNINNPLPKALNKIKNGKYIMVIPTNAINFKNEYEAIIEKIEFYKNQQLVCLNINNNIVFAILDGKYNVNDKIKIGIDFKKISINDLNDKEIVHPLDIVNSVEAKLVKIKDKKEVYFKLLIHNNYFDVSNEILEKIFSSLSINALKTTYLIQFTAFDYIIDENGIETIVVDNYDYNDEYFIKTKYDDKYYILYSDIKYNNGDIIKIKPNIDKISIIDITTQIKII